MRVGRTTFIPIGNGLAGVRLSPGAPGAKDEKPMGPLLFMLIGFSPIFFAEGVLFFCIWMGWL